MIISGMPGEDGRIALTFVLPAAQVPGPTSVVGDFNGWNPYAHPLRPAEDGTYQATVTVPADREICFRYLADGGVWFDDPDAEWHDAHGGHLVPERVRRMSWEADEPALAGRGVDLGPIGFERPTFGPVPSV